MRIEHVAVWADDLQRLRDFYVAWFGARCGDRYENPAKGFSSYFLYFDDDTARLELMHSDFATVRGHAGPSAGFAHLAFSLGSREAVDALTARLHAAGHRVLSAPRVTGDGYYESVVEDPEGNMIELTE